MKLTEYSEKVNQTDFEWIKFVCEDPHDLNFVSMCDKLVFVTYSCNFKSLVKKNYTLGEGSDAIEGNGTTQKITLTLYNYTWLF